MADKVLLAAIFFFDSDIEIAAALVVFKSVRANAPCGTAD